jgi:hypothetical protein
MKHPLRVFAAGIGEDDANLAAWRSIAENTRNVRIKPYLVTPHAICVTCSGEVRPILKLRFLKLYILDFRYPNLLQLYPHIWSLITC